MAFKGNIYKPTLSFSWLPGSVWERWTFVVENFPSGTFRPWVVAAGRHLLKNYPTA